MTKIKEVTDLFYLAFVTWREARGETGEGQAAVAHSILNRVDNPRWWGRSLDEVVTKAWQYSSMTDPHDPQLAKAWPKLTDASWIKTFGICSQVLMGLEPNPCPTADSYYDISIPPPSWATNPKVKFVRQVGRIRFYNTKAA